MVVRGRESLMQAGVLRDLALHSLATSDFAFGDSLHFSEVAPGWKVVFGHGWIDTSADNCDGKVGNAISIDNRAIHLH